MPYSADPRASYINLEINMTWVEMHFNDLGKTLEYQGEEFQKQNTEDMLGMTLEQSVRDYIQRKMFWNRDEALEKYSAFETVWDLIEDVVYEFANKYSDRLWIKKEDEVDNECSYCGEQASGNYGEESVLMCAGHRDRGRFCASCGKVKPDDCECDETESE